MKAFEVFIRPAQEADLPALEWGGEYRRYRQLYQRAMWEANQGRRALFVVEVEGEIVGQIFVQFGCNRLELNDKSSIGYIQSFRIKPAFRNLGIGTRLINQAEDVLRDRKFHRAVVAVAQENRAARRLYERLGYTVFAEDPGQWSYVDDHGQLQYVSEPAYLLQKQL
ncbi:MAG: GNAT family N-acetyltransferase [Anaerolineales bacterium]|nr:MAG: GNAT family N-acetyltransferase [Anaerolineales bacterium]